MGLADKYSRRVLLVGATIGAVLGGTGFYRFNDHYDDVKDGKKIVADSLETQRIVAKYDSARFSNKNDTALFTGGEPYLGKRAYEMSPKVTYSSLIADAQAGHDKRKAELRANIDDIRGMSVLLGLSGAVAGFMLAGMSLMRFGQKPIDRAGEWLADKKIGHQRV